MVQNNQEMFSSINPRAICAINYYDRVYLRVSHVVSLKLTSLVPGLSLCREQGTCIDCKQYVLYLVLYLSVQSVWLDHKMLLSDVVGYLGTRMQT